MKLTSSAFDPNQRIPARYTCEDVDVSPPLSWSDAPSGTKSLVILLEDPDAPDPAAPRRVWVHWLVFDIPPFVTALVEGAADNLPGGARHGKNDWGTATYRGPCPPIGRHRYFHRVYALDTVLELTQPTKLELERAMRGHILGQAEFVGTYEKSR